MKNPLKTIEVAHLWLEKGKHDLINAEHTLTMTEECPFDTVCFHAQQCVEKHIKALLVAHSINFSKTHDLTELYVLIPKEFNVVLNVDELSLLNDYSVDIRYPGLEEPLGRYEAEEAVAIAIRIANIIQDGICYIKG